MLNFASFLDARTRQLTHTLNGRSAMMMPKFNIHGSQMASIHTSEGLGTPSNCLGSQAFKF